jgi:hypothetical protein
MATDRLNNKAANRYKAKSKSGGNKRDKRWLFLKDKFDIGVEAKRPFERIWVPTLAFLAGNQWYHWNTAAHQLDAITKPKNQMRITDNLLLPKWRRQIADLIKTDPTMSVVPQTNDAEDVKAAKVGNDVIKSFWQTNQLRVKIRQMAGWMYGTGNGFIDDRWNPKLGPVEKQTDPKTGETKLIYLGDADCGVWSPFEIFVPFIAMGETDLHAFPWLIKAKRRSLDWIANNYTRGDEVKEESFSASFMSSAALMGTSQEALGAKIPSATVMDFYLQPNRDYPNGLFLTGANGIILAENDYPINYYHLEHFKDIDVPGVFWGQATSSNALGLQFTWNTTLTSVAQYNHLVAKAKLFVPKGAKLAYGVDDQHGEEVSYTPIYGIKPEYLTLKGLPSTIDQIMALTKTSLMDLFNQHEVSQGTNKSDIRSGEMVSLLREQDAHGNIPSHAIFEESLERLMKRVLERIRKEYTTQRMLKIMGDEGEFQVFEFKGTDLRNNTDIVVRRESSLPDSRTDRETKILRKYELGLYGPLEDPKVRRSVMRMIDDVAANSLYEPDRLDERIAERENHILMQAEGMDENAAIAMVNKYDNHVIHDEILTKFRKSTDYQKLKYSENEEDQQKFMEMEARFNAHNGIHKEFIAEQQKALLQQQLMLQGGKGGSSK